MVYALTSIILAFLLFTLKSYQNTAISIFFLTSAIKLTQITARINFNFFFLKKKTQIIFDQNKTKSTFCEKWGKRNYVGNFKMEKKTLISNIQLNILTFLN